MSITVLNNRMRILGLLLLLAGIFSLLRLFQLQVLQHERYRVLASEEHLRKYEIAAERGEIYVLDRDQKVPLALNQMRQTLYADPRFIEDKRATAETLTDIIGGSSQEIAEKMDSDSYYVVLRREVEPATAERIEELQLPGIGLQDNPQRVYPEGTLASQVVGFINHDGVGQYGVEAQYDKILKGKSGLLKAKTDTRGIPIATAENTQVNPRPGHDIVLTIDRNIQAKVESALKTYLERYSAPRASAVVMDATNGRIAAMGNVPTYNPNTFDEVEDYEVFQNQVVSGAYEPGSVMKGLTMAAGLNQGAVTPRSTYQDHGQVTVNGWEIENASGIPTGTYSMHDVIAKSINTGVVYVLEQLGEGAINQQAKETLHNYFTDRFHIGSQTGITLPNEAPGSIHPPTASDVNYANMTFGQGMTTTMLQVAAAYGALANGGTLYRLQIVDHTIKPDGNITMRTPQVRGDSVLAKSTIEQLKPMFEAVVQETGDATITGYRIGGKSGTAQLPDPEGGYFENRDVGTFVGIVTLDRPRYVIVTRIDEPQIGTFASAAARLMFADIAEWLVNYDGLPPRSGG